VKQVLAQGRARLASGLWVVFFPEGTRMPVGETRRYGASGALLAADAGKLIVPVAHNAGSYWPRRGWLKRPGTVRVVIGPPIAAAGRNVREINREVQEWIEATVARLTA
jgi:1-acyl-sn-glycerol-3-phosphate acyltransferase